MSDERKTLGEFVSMEVKTFGGEVKYMIKYKQPNSQDPAREWNHGIIEANASDDTLERVAGLSAGERMCVWQNKDEKGFTIITNITDAKDAPEKWSGGGKKGGWSGNGGGGGEGAQIGNALNNAAVLLGAGKTVAELEVTAWEIIEVGERLKAKLKASKEKAGAVGAAPKAEEAKPMSKIEQLKAKKAAESKQPEDKPEDLKELEDDLDSVVF